MKLGEDIKVHLPGESPWTIVLEIKDGRFKGKINNKMFHEMCEFDQAWFMKQTFGTVEHLENLHGIKQGDELWFEKNEYDCWVPGEKT